MEMNVNVGPDWGAPSDKQAVASTVASDRGAGNLGFTGTGREQAVADAAGLAKLAGADSAGGPTTPMLPGTRNPNEAAHVAEGGERG
jgi:PPE-repeat protein